MNTTDKILRSIAYCEDGSDGKAFESMKWYEQALALLIMLSLIAIFSPFFAARDLFKSVQVKFTEEESFISDRGAYSKRARRYFWAPWMFNCPQRDVMLSRIIFSSKATVFDRHTGEYLGVAGKVKTPGVLDQILPEYPL